MSGIVGILNLDGAPASHHLLQELTDFLKPRGPDAQQIWADGPVGFGHTLFKTTEESEFESQPFTLGSGTWITADARIDAQQELIRELCARGQEPAPHVTDPELILRAYEAWGEACVEHLLGDFALESGTDGASGSFALAIIWASGPCTMPELDRSSSSVTRWIAFANVPSYRIG